MKLTIPYYLHKAGAGFPSPATDYIEEDIDLNVHLIKIATLENCLITFQEAMKKTKKLK